MMGRRRRRKRKRVLAMIAVLLAVLVWLTFDGRIPLSGDRVGTGSGARRSTRAAAPSGRTVPQAAVPRTTEVGPSDGRIVDRVAGRRARLGWLLESGDFVAAATLARAMAEHGATPAEREFGASALDASSGAVVRALEAQLRVAAQDGRARRVEEDYALLRQLAPRRADALFFEVRAPVPAAGDSLASLRAVLPIVLDATTELWKLGRADCVLRVRGERGGYRYKTVSIAELDPVVLRRGLLRAFDVDGRAGPFAAMARLFERAERPFAARLVRCGVRPAAPRDPSHATKGSR